MKRILIASDGSESGFDALEQGFSIASAVGAAVTVVYVSRPPSRFLGEPYYEDVITEEARQARGVVSTAQHHADAFDLEVDYEVREGDPVEEILDLARARDVDLIVLGSRGLGAVSSLVLGSVSTAILHHADRPVLVTRARVGAAV